MPRKCYQLGHVEYLVLIFLRKLYNGKCMSKGEPLYTAAWQLWEGYFFSFFPNSKEHDQQAAVERKGFATETAVKCSGPHCRKEEASDLGQRIEAGQAREGTNRLPLQCALYGWKTAVENSGLWYHTGCLQQSGELYTVSLPCPFVWSSCSAVQRTYTRRYLRCMLVLYKWMFSMQWASVHYKASQKPRRQSFDKGASAMEWRKYNLFN